MISIFPKFKLVCYIRLKTVNLYDVLYANGCELLLLCPSIHKLTKLAESKGDYTWQCLL